MPLTPSMSLIMSTRIEAIPHVLWIRLRRSLPSRVPELTVGCWVRWWGTDNEPGSFPRLSRKYRGACRPGQGGSRDHPPRRGGPQDTMAIAEKERSGATQMCFEGDPKGGNVMRPEGK